eukprot:gene7480-556_t
MSGTCVLDDRKVYNTTTAYHPELHMQTTSEQWAAVLDVMTNVVFADNAAEQEVTDHKSVMQLKSHLQEESDNEKKAHITSLQQTVRSLSHHLKAIERELSVLIRGKGISPIETASMPIYLSSSSPELEAAEGLIHAHNFLEENHAGESLQDQIELGFPVTTDLKLRIKQLEEEWGQTKRFMKLARRDLTSYIHALRESFVGFTLDNFDQDLEFMSLAELKMDSWIWILRDSDPSSYFREIVEQSVQQFSLQLDRHDNGAGYHHLQFCDITIRNRLPNEKYPVVVGRFVGPGALAPFDRNLFFRYYAKLGPPVGGIPILQHVELNCSPTLLQLSHNFKIGTHMLHFPLVGSQEPNSFNGHSATCSSTEDSIKELQEMQTRAKHNKTFLFVKVPRVQPYAICHILMEKSSEMCTFQDLLGKIKRDATATVLSQAFSHKLSLFKSEDEKAAGGLVALSSKPREKPVECHDPITSSRLQGFKNKLRRKLVKPTKTATPQNQPSQTHNLDESLRQHFHSSTSNEYDSLPSPQDLHLEKHPSVAKEDIACPGHSETGYPGNMTESSDPDSSGCNLHTTFLDKNPIAPPRTRNQQMRNLPKPQP